MSESAPRGPMRNADVVRAAFAAYMAQDRDTASLLLADDFAFSSPQDDRLDKRRYLETCFPTTGRLSSQEILEVTEAGDDGVFILYEYALKTGERYRNAEYIRLRNGQLVETQVFFGGQLLDRPSEPACGGEVPFTLPSRSPGGNHVETRPPLPPFTLATAQQKVQAAEDGWNTRDPERVALAYTEDSTWRNRDEFFQGRPAIVEFLRRKWARELDYRLRKELWAFTDNRISVRFEYECHDDQGRWWRSYGNEQWEFAESGLMRRREASINDCRIEEHERRIGVTT